jgi:hypothetical protein
MRLTGYLLGFLAVFGVTAHAQEWELGGAGGYGFYRNQDVTSGNVTGKAGFNKGFAFSAVGGHNAFRYLSGEMRYVYRDSDLRVTSGGQKVDFSGDAQIVHYDALIHPPAEDWRIQPFFAFGGGIKVFRGTGQETEFQPLDQLAVLTKTDELKPLLSLGGGLKFRLGDHAVLRFDVRDYITPFPGNVVLPAPGAKLRGWLHDFVPMLGISAVF